MIASWMWGGGKAVVWRAEMLSSGGHEVMEAYLLC
jgi:hypothetical protein